MKTNISTRLGTLLATMLVVGCGGGGDGSIAGSTVVAPGQVASSVTVANAPSLAAQGYSALASLGNRADAGNLFTVGVSISPQQIGVVDASLALLYKKPGLDNNLPLGTTYEENCAQGGSVSITETASLISITANNCRESGLRMNGTMSASLSNLSGTPGPTTTWGGTIAISYQRMSVEYDGQGLHINGGMTLVYSQSSSGQVTNSNVSGQSLHLYLTENNAVVLNSLLQQFSFTSSYNFGTSTDTGSFNYAANGTAIDPTSYSLVTNTAFVSNSSSYPHTGAFTLTASNNSTLRLTALSATQVQLDIDLDGNGSVDHTSVVSWSTLANQI